MSAHPLVRVEVHEGIATLSIHHPPANVLSLDTLEALDEVFRRVLVDSAVKVVILTGEGQSFSAGADIKELAALGDRRAGQAFARVGQAMCDLIEGASKPVIAAINGRFALGGGNELAMACHLRLAEESTQFGNPEVRLGLVVGWGASQRLPRLVGRGKALELLLTGRRITACEAQRIGLVNRVVADGTVLQEATSLAGELALLSAPALAATLEMIRVGLGKGVDAGLEEEASQFGFLCEGEDWHEGTRAFLEKRKPRFTDR